ncbi:MAG: 4-(cytidine 5'-diphospho)-2-C-methyl-D-erythritol kinase [Bacteroidota bacterium]|nr:4-(cytidine 5'-diphospho)-2-C-methyl-D-erythritol kinase [Bacteroidota bacterium]
MVLFPNCKINLGLNVISRRSDGFHNIETAFYPIFWQDVLEVIEMKSNDKDFELSQSGIIVDAKIEDNLIYKAYNLIIKIKTLPPLKVHLHKNIPMGAGLGGGSSDAAFFINLLDTKFKLNFSEVDKLNIASQIGSDCAFFIKNKPVFAKGKGNEFEEIALDLSKYYILVVYPALHSNTKEAYEGLTPKIPKHNLKSVIENNPINQWKDYITNDFEETIFKKYPVIKELKDLLYSNKAVYASMSGSGSAVFGIFNEEPTDIFVGNYKTFLQAPFNK